MGFQKNIYNVGLFQLLHLVEVEMCKNDRYWCHLDLYNYRSEYE
jgi:hypothetical protein